MAIGITAARSQFLNARNHIVDEVLPDNRNFTALKSLGLDYITKMSGRSWNDFNESDPGITVLDQLCYALTELGYCNNFPLADILTHRNGDLVFEDQFFSPDEILCCSPVTISDYRKLVVDAIEPVKNIYLYAETAAGRVTGRLESYLYVDPALPEQERQPLIKTVYRLLNAHRNIAESFLEPRILRPLKVRLVGSIELSTGASIDKVRSSLRHALESYASPAISQLGYQAMLERGCATDYIFSGPRLHHGWVPEEDLNNPKCNCIRVTDVLPIIEKVSGIDAVSSLHFEADDEGSIESGEIRIAREQTVEFEFPEKSLTLHSQRRGSNNIAYMANHHLQSMKESHEKAPIGATVDLVPEMPQGRYRNISDYYSIQNTFPTQYAIGHDSMQSSASSYRVAQSRQLKGYLLIFDQLLANQFSQLANVSKLFSFRGDTPGLDFAPTYYFQPLYDLPDVEPLLVGSQKYDYSTVSEDTTAMERQRWKRFREDPFNEYVHGLRQIMEGDAENDDRRNRMLNHLLARHGECAELYDEIIGEAQWYGSNQKTRIAIKEQLLQNYQKLSYNRVKACDFISAAPLGTPGRFRLTEADHARLRGLAISWNTLSVLRQFVGQGFDDKESLLQTIYDTGRDVIPAAEMADLFAKLEITDGKAAAGKTFEPVNGKCRIDSDGHERLKRLDASQFRDSSTFELKVNLVLSLSEYYHAVIDHLLQLLNCEQFTHWLGCTDQANTFHLPHSDISVERQGFVHHVSDGDEIIMTIRSEVSLHPALDLYQAHIDQLQWLADQRSGFLFIENNLVKKAIQETVTSSHHDLPNEWFYLSTTSVFPEYLPAIATPDFQKRIRQISEMHCPAHVKNAFKLTSFSDMKTAIPAFVKLHNAARTITPGPVDSAALRVLIEAFISPLETLI